MVANSLFSSSLLGGPIDLTPFGGLLVDIGFFYWALIIGALLLAFWKPKSWLGKGLAVTLVLGVLVYPVASREWVKQKLKYAYQQKLAAATERFEMRCKGSGEKISRVVRGIDGVVWMRWRDPVPSWKDQFLLNDPFGADCSNEYCIQNLLRATKGIELNERDAKKHTNGYRFIEALDPSSRKIYRFVGAMRLSDAWTPAALDKYMADHGEGPPSLVYTFLPEREQIDKFSARYGVVWDDISTQEDRENWIAGSSLKVIDLATNEVIAERIGYMMDRGLGNTHGERSPWAYAIENACPSFKYDSVVGRHMRTGHETRDFLLKVLQVSKGDE